MVQTHIIENYGPCGNKLLLCADTGLVVQRQTLFPCCLDTLGGILAVTCVLRIGSRLEENLYVFSTRYSECQNRFHRQGRRISSCCTLCYELLSVLE